VDLFGDNLELTIREEYLMVFIFVQNVAGIGAVIFVT